MWKTLYAYIIPKMVKVLSRHRKEENNRPKERDQKTKHKRVQCAKLWGNRMEFMFIIENSCSVLYLWMLLQRWPKSLSTQYKREKKRKTVEHIKH